MTIVPAPWAPAADAVEVRAGELGALLTRVIPHADMGEDPYPALAVVRLEAVGEWLFAVATDRYSFAIARQFTGLAGENPPEWTFDVPLTAARELIDRYGPATLYALENQADTERPNAEADQRLMAALDAREVTLRLKVTDGPHGKRLTVRTIAGGAHSGRWSWLDAHDLTCKGRRTGATCRADETGWNPTCRYGRMPNWRPILRRALDGRLDENSTVYATQDRTSRWGAPYSMHSASWWPVLVDGQREPVYQVVASGDDMIGLQHIRPNDHPAPTTWDRVRALWHRDVADDSEQASEVTS